MKVFSLLQLHALFAALVFDSCDASLTNSKMLSFTLLYVLSRATMIVRLLMMFVFHMCQWSRVCLTCLDFIRALSSCPGIGPANM